jgi:hypothetical protein
VYSPPLTIENITDIHGEIRKLKMPFKKNNTEMKGYELYP